MRRINLFLSFLLFGLPPCATTTHRRQRVSIAAAWAKATQAASGPDLRCIKPWWQSKTIWLNALVATMATVEANFHVLDGVLPANLYKWALFALPIVNIWLRGSTTRGVTWRRASRSAGDAQ